MRGLRNVLVTGGSGFIGSNTIRYLFARGEFEGRVINVDALTYAGNPDNLIEVDEEHGPAGDRRYRFVHGDITDFDLVTDLFTQHDIDTVLHFAAESHVDRSIIGPRAFIQTNMIGTYNLLEAARARWTGRDDVLFHHVSTDEVFGSLGDDGAFTEATPYDPRSPYSASKAASDHLVRAWGHTYGLPFTLSNCSNNYGPYQFPEKMIPLMILNMMDRKPLPVYGDGSNIRDWLFVDDHSSALWNILTAGTAGMTYLIGGENEWRNIDLVKRLCAIVADETGCEERELTDLITYVTDRPGHDLRYAIDCSRIKRDLSWRQTYSFADGLRATVRWYRDNPDWVSRVRSGDYRRWIAANYSAR